MSSKPDIIEISSDSSQISSDKLPTPPPYVDDSSSFELSSMPSYVSSYHSSEDEQGQTKSPAVTSKGARDKAVSNKGTSSTHVQSHSHLKPGKREQVLGLTNQHNWEEIKGRGKKSMPDPKGKGKRSIG